MSSLAFVGYRITTLFLLAFIVLFVRRRYDWPRTILIAVGTFTLISVIDALLVLPGSLGQQGLWSFIEVIIVQAMVFLVSRYRDFRALFTGVTGSAFVAVGNVAEAFARLAFNSETAGLILMTVVDATLFIIFVLRMREFYLEEMDLKTTGWASLCVIPVLFNLIIYALLLQPIEDPAYMIVPQVSTLLLMAYAYALLFRLAVERRRENEQARNNDLLETYATALSRETRMMRESEMETSLVRHDIRHQMALISAYLDAGQTQKVRDLILKLDDRLVAAQPQQYCSNAALNGVIANYANEAKVRNVSFTCAAAVPERIPDSYEFELATVVANLLDNAITAASEVPDTADRFVRAKIGRVKDQAIIEISNSFIGERHFAPENGLPISTQGEGHGYGLRSVQAFAKKHGGLFDYSSDDDVFCVRIVFDPRDEAEVSGKS